ncbi:MAG: GIDE domain-containing protein [Myxococcota bacterium]
MQNDGEVVGWLLGGVVGGLVLLARGFRAWRRLRLVEDTPTARARSMALGRVELFGRAQGKADLEAPFTGLPCVYYRYRIEKEVRSNRRRSWRTVARGDSSAWGFYLEDETGRVLVEPAGAEVDVSHDWNETNPELGPRLQAALAQAGVGSSGWLFRRKLRFTEWRIAAGESLYVLGVAQERHGLAAERRRRIHEKLAAWKRDPEAMAHFDVDGDGRVDAEEWEVARRLVVQEVSLDAVDDRVVVAADADGNSPFYVTDREEGRVRTRYRWRAFGGIYGGAALCLGCAAALLHQLDLLGRF